MAEEKTKFDRTPIERKKEKNASTEEKLKLETGKQLTDLADEKLKEIEFLIDDDNILNIFEWSAKFFQFHKYRQMRATDMLEFGGSHALGTLLLTIKEDIKEEDFVKNIVSLYNNVYTDAKISLTQNTLAKLGEKMTNRSEIQKNWFQLVRMFSGRIQNILRDGVNDVSKVDLPKSSDAIIDKVNNTKIVTLSPEQLWVYQAWFQRFVETNKNQVGLQSQDFVDKNPSLSKKDIKVLTDKINGDTTLDQSQKAQLLQILDQKAEKVSHALHLQWLFLWYIQDKLITATNTSYETVTETIIKEIKVNKDGSLTIINDNSNDLSRFSKPVVDINTDGTPKITTTPDKQVTHLLSLWAQYGLQLTRTMQWFVGAGAWVGLADGKIVAGGGSIYTWVSQQIYKSLSTSLTGVLWFVQWWFTTGAALWLNWSPKLNKSEESGKAQVNLVTGVGVWADIKGNGITKWAYVWVSLDKMGGINGFVHRMDHVLTKTLANYFIENKSTAFDSGSFATKLAKLKDGFDANTRTDMATRLDQMIKVSGLSSLSNLLQKDQLTDLDKWQIDDAIARGLTQPLIRNISTERRQDTRKVSFGGIIVSWAEIAAAIASWWVTIAPSILWMGIWSAKINTAVTTSQSITSKDDMKSITTSKDLYSAKVTLLEHYFDWLVVDSATGQISYEAPKWYTVEYSDPDTSDMIKKITGGDIITIDDASKTITISHNTDAAKISSITISYAPSREDSVEKKDRIKSETQKFEFVMLDKPGWVDWISENTWILHKNDWRLQTHFKPQMDNVYQNGKLNSKLLQWLKNSILEIVVFKWLTFSDDDLFLYKQLLYVRNQLTLSDTFGKIKSWDKISKKEVLNAPWKSMQEKLFNYRTNKLKPRLEKEGRWAKFVAQYVALRQKAFTEMKNNIGTTIVWVSRAVNDRAFAINTWYDTEQVSEIFNINPDYVYPSYPINDTTTNRDSYFEVINYFMDKITTQTPLFVETFKQYPKLSNLSNVDLAQLIQQSIVEAKWIAPYTILLKDWSKVQRTWVIGFGFDYKCMNESLDIHQIDIWSLSPPKKDTSPRPDEQITITKKTIETPKKDYSEKVMDMRWSSIGVAAGVGQMAREIIVNRKERKTDTTGEITTHVDIETMKIETLVTIKQDDKEWVVKVESGKTYLVEVKTDPKTGIVTVVVGGIVYEVEVKSGTTYQVIFQGTRPKPIDAATKQTVTWNTSQDIFNSQRPKPITTTTTAKDKIPAVIGRYGPMWNPEIIKQKISPTVTISNLSQALGN